MTIDEKDVQVDSSATDETIKEGEVSSAPQEESGDVQPVTNEQQVIEEADEKGVPWRNRAEEYKRKYSNLENELTSIKTSLPELLKKAVSEAVPNNQDGKPKYTKEELIRFKNSTDNAEHRAWAEIELEKVRSEETRREFESIRERERMAARLDNEKRDAIQQVMAMYPSAFKNGQWDNSHPLTQRIAAVYNSDPVLQQHGYGLVAAAKMAFADYITEQQPNLVRKEKTMKQTIKKLEKATLVEGSGVSQVPKGKSELQKAVERFNISGKEEDLKTVMKLRMKLKQGVAQGE